MKGLKIFVIFLTLLPLFTLNGFAQDFRYISLGGHSGSVNSVAFSPDGKTLASGSYDNMILLWDAKMSNLLWKRDHGSTVFSVAFSPDSSTLASAGVGGSIYLWDVDTGVHKQTFEGHASLIYSVAFSPDGKTLASGSRDGTIRLWDVLTGKPKHVWDGSEVYSVAFSPDGKTLASGGWLIHLYDTDTGAHIQSLEGHTNWVVSVAFSPDGKTLASGSSDLTVRLWDTNTGELLRTLEGHTDKVSSVAFSPDGKMLASGSWDNLAVEDHIVRLWDTNTGNLLRTLEGHTDGVNSVAFSPDGKTLVSGSEDVTVRLWDVSMLSQLLFADVNGDGVVNIQDLVLIASSFGESVPEEGHLADVNEDGLINIVDLVKVAGALGTGTAAPAVIAEAQHITLTQADVQQWLTQAQQLNFTDPTSLRGIRFLEQLLAAFTPKETALLANYPNPFNPETWIPYQLAKSAVVKLTIYAVDGKLVLTLDLGHQPTGSYQTRSRAAHWDGRNQVGEPVASGVYFYTLIAGDFSATRKMLIMK